jgi:hypothetical protein
VPDREPGRPWLFLVAQYLSITADHGGGRWAAVEIILNSIFAREENRLRRVRLVATGSESGGASRRTLSVRQGSLGSGTRRRRSGPISTERKGVPASVILHH